MKKTKMIWLPDDEKSFMTCLPTSVDFSTLSAFKRSLQRVNLNEFF